jgi:hypothetical protein
MLDRARGAHRRGAPARQRSPLQHSLADGKRKGGWWINIGLGIGLGARRAPTRAPGPQQHAIDPFLHFQLMKSEGRGGGG